MLALSMLSTSAVSRTGRGGPKRRARLVAAADAKNGYWNSARIRGVHLATDGTYVVDDLPPGDYLVAALADVDSSDWFDPDCLANIRPQAIPVTLVAGARVTQSLRIADGV